MRLIRFLFFGLAAGILLSGCGRRLNAGSQAVLRYPLASLPSSLDPARASDASTAELLGNIYEGLVAFDERGRVIPCLAARWDVSRDGRTYTFHLRPGVMFHDGRALTARDVQYSLERALWPETASPTGAGCLSGIVGARAVADGQRRDLPGVRVIAPLALAITLDRPRACFPDQLAHAACSVVCREAVECNGGQLDEKAAVGTGPFRLTEYRHGSRIVLTAHAAYWGGRPKLARIERPIVLDPQAARRMYENGELDACAITRAGYADVRRQPRLQAEASLLPTARVFYVVMHPRLQPVFRDARVRQAFARVVDKDAIVRAASRGVWQRADSFLPPGLPGCEGIPPRLSYDPVAARRLLAKAGYPGGRGFPRLTLVYMENQPEIGVAARSLRDDLKRNLGIAIDTREREGVTFLADAGSEKIPFYIASWTAGYPDPQALLSTLLRAGAPLNHVAYSSARFDALCDRADAEPDARKRSALYREADRLAMGEAAVLPLAFDRQPMLLKPYVRGWRTSVLVLALPHRTTRIQR